MKSKFLKKYAAEQGIEVIDVELPKFEIQDLCGIHGVGKVVEVTNDDIKLDPSKPAYIVRTK